MFSGRALVEEGPIPMPNCKKFDVSRTRRVALPVKDAWDGPLSSHGDLFGRVALARCFVDT